jgi:hypothetical protein
MTDSRWCAGYWVGPLQGAGGGGVIQSESAIGIRESDKLTAWTIGGDGCAGRGVAGGIADHAAEVQRSLGCGDRSEAQQPQSNYGDQTDREALEVRFHGGMGARSG